MNWKLPNQLTIGRIVLSLGFFALLAVYKQGTVCGRYLLNIAFIIYIVAGITDVLDGYLARKWKVTSAFGRMVDPIVDKVMVVGAFVMLAGRNFAVGDVAGVEPTQLEASGPIWLTGGMVSGVQSWMVVAILVRELIVSAVRGYSESRGRVFPATVGGKVKMFIQSLAICVALFQVANLPESSWAAILKISLVWLAMLVTVGSGLIYMGKAIEVFKIDD